MLPLIRTAVRLLTPVHARIERINESLFISNVGKRLTRLRYIFITESLNVPWAGCVMNFCEDSLLLAVRIPKSGSSSLFYALERAFREAATFYLPNTLELDGRLSRLQHLRFRRAQIRNLLAHYGRAHLQDVFALIDSRAAPGDLLSGGHIDFPTVRCNLRKRVKIITILRNPYERCRSEYFYARQNYLKKSALARLDSNAVAQIAAKHDFDGYLDFLSEHRAIYGNVAASYLGVSALDDLQSFFQANVFHAGVLEHSRQFARNLSDKIGRPVDFPHLNETGSERHVALGAGVKRKIERLYERDFLLYEWQLTAIPAAERISAPARIHLLVGMQAEEREAEVSASSYARRPKWTDNARRASGAAMQAIRSLKSFAGSRREAIVELVTGKRPALPAGKALAFLFAPPILRLLIRLARDSRVPVAARLTAAMALCYRISPVDLIPDSIPVFGYLDDVVVIGICIVLTRRYIPPEVMAEHLAAIGSR